MLRELLEVTDKLNHIKDLDAVLDRILLEARRFTGADAGSIYLVENDRLRFSYVQNDSLFKGKTSASRHLYTDNTIPIDEKSIAGYVALTGEPLMIADAYKINPALPYSFNPSFDRQNNYRTRSILTVAMNINHSNLVGILQIINKKSGRSDDFTFTEDDRLCVVHFANSAAAAIERAKLTREIILRMIRMAELRDPKETGTHVNRVGAYSIEIYQKWALEKGVPETEIKKYKDNLRIAAMLHDVGKVAISDLILKKPAKLDEAEFKAMQLHTVMGYRLFQNRTSDLDQISAEVCLNHHEKWDGTGYPGKFHVISNETISMGEGKKELDIPLPGRIVALSDVYDALISKRVYKDSWDEGEVLKYIKNQSGKQFDPELVESFFSITDTFNAIRLKYKE